METRFRYRLSAFRSAVLATALAPLLLACAKPESAPQIEWTPPPFELATTDGQVFRYPDDLTGLTIVYFWATWCPYCKALMPHLQSILDEYGPGLPFWP